MEKFHTNKHRFWCLSCIKLPAVSKKGVKCLPGRKKEKCRSCGEKVFLVGAIFVIVMTKCFTGPYSCSTVHELHHAWLHSSHLLSPLTESGLLWQPCRRCPDILSTQSDAQAGRGASAGSSSRLPFGSVLTAAPVERAALIFGTESI